MNSPVLIVQNMCDQAEDEALRPPVEDEELRAFPFRKVLHYSALKNRGRGALDEALQQAILWLRKTMGQARIGKGRLAVKRKLEALRDEDAKLPAEQRKYRTLTQEYFHQLCADAGGVSRPELLLDYLHHAGIVFYREGLFDDRIVLDQAWRWRRCMPSFIGRNAIASCTSSEAASPARCSKRWCGVITTSRNRSFSSA